MLKIISTYTLTQYINKGEYGKVYKAIDHNTQQYVAIKMISLDKFIEKSKLIELTRQQVQILYSLENNPNIIKLKEIIKSNRFLYLVYEYCQGGTLEQFCHQKGPIPQKQAIKLFRQLTNAYRSLYEKNIVHRDIKPDNIFFKGNTLKLADFGFCKQLKFTDDLTQTSLGSPLYMAPQVLNNDVYGSKADLWSCGIILYQMLFGKTPYGTCNMKDLLNQYDTKDQVPMPQEKRYLSPVLVQMLRKMLSKDQFRRISWEDFFYEYQFLENGDIKNKEKDFEYDLMKLMKRNSSSEVSHKNTVPGAGNNKFSKFDWSKITEMNSSVHSQECNQQIDTYNEHQRQGANLSHYRQIAQQQKPKRDGHPSFGSSNPSLSHSLSAGSIKSPQEEEILALYNLKKTIKNFEEEHSKIYELLTIVESLLESQKQHEYDSRVVYFLIFNIERLLKINIEKVSQHIRVNEQILITLPDERNKLQRLKRIFQKEHSQNSLKINSMKTTLITLEEVQGQLFRYPRKDITRKVMKEYIQNYELQIPGILDMDCGSQWENLKLQSVKLLKILWGVNLVYTQGYGQVNQKRLSSQRQIVPSSQTKRYKYSSIISIKDQRSERQIKGLLNRFLVELGI